MDPVERGILAGNVMGALLVFGLLISLFYLIRMLFG